MKKARLKQFIKWLELNGAVVEPTATEWEVLRCRTRDGLQVVYRNKHGGETWPVPLRKALNKFDDGKNIPMAPDPRRRRNARAKLQRIAQRDGMSCFFCGKEFEVLDDPDLTVEHLVPHSHRGPDHISNLAMACQECNGLAGNLSVVEKVRLRDERLSANKDQS